MVIFILYSTHWVCCQWALPNVSQYTSFFRLYRLKPLLFVLCNYIEYIFWNFILSFYVLGTFIIENTVYICTHSYKFVNTLTHTNEHTHTHKQTHRHKYTNIQTKFSEKIYILTQQRKLLNILFSFKNFLFETFWFEIVCNLYQFVSVKIPQNNYRKVIAFSVDICFIRGGNAKKQECSPNTLEAFHIYTFRKHLNDKNIFQLGFRFYDYSKRIMLYNALSRWWIRRKKRRLRRKRFIFIIIMERFYVRTIFANFDGFSSFLFFFLRFSASLVYNIQIWK